MVETNVATPDYPRGLTFEKVWEMFQETDRLIKELRESQKETALQMQETAIQMKETDKKLDKVSENVGGLNRSMGELIETLIASRLWEKFAAYPYNLQRAYQRYNVYDENNRALTDVDILLSDTEWVMAVEVKREVNMDDIDRHVKRMGLVRKYPPAEAKGKKLLGAIAGGVVPPDVCNYAHEAGFFVLELKGESVTLIAQPEGFTPKIW